MSEDSKKIIKEMELPVITVEEITKKIENMKKRKSAGPDRVKAEVLQEIAKHKN